jgi:tRNA-specific 2-thiouridylase
MLADAPFASHLGRPRGRGHTPEDAFTGAAGGAACGDLVRISLALDPASPDGAILDAGFDASGCGAAIAAGSATVALLRDTPLLAAARLGTDEIAAELGGLHPAKRHAAELAADALHRALGAAARARAALSAPAGGATRALVAMSGGVDSAVAALLTAREGEDVVGVTLELWSDPENDGDRSCCSAQAVRGARALAHSQGVPHLSIDLRAEFRAGVVDGWLADHARGLTPNPCVRCNGNVRLDAMLGLADRLGAARLVTGHYARVHRDGDSGEERGHAQRTADTGVEATQPLLRMARDPIKDQSYVLAGLHPDSLARLRFPLGDMTKAEVREIAAEAGLAVARKPDSQDLCFLAGTGRDAFLARHGSLGERAGAIVDAASGREIGRHSGVHHYTVGQRKGLGVGGGTPLYVLRTDPDANTVAVGPRERLATRTVAVCDAVLHRPRFDHVRLRYRQRPLRATRLRNGTLELDETAFGVAPGQLACLMAGELIVGHATITRSRP